MPANKRPRELIERNADIADYGEKDQRGAYSEPLAIAGEKVNVDDLPPLTEADKPKPSR